MKNLLLVSKAKFIFILFILFGFSEAKAQSYIPLLDTAKQWNVTETFYGFSTKTFFLTISSNDTLINNINYKIIQQEGFSYYPNELKFIREDTATRRVYGIRQGQTEEFLLYDFSLAVGDTIESDISYYCVNSFSVHRIDTVTLLNNEKRRKWTLGEVVLASPSHYYLEWIEGIGNLDILMYPTSCTFPHAPTYSLLCYYENDIQLYEHAIYDTCYIDYVSSVSSQGEKDLRITAYPNPVIDVLNIEIDTKEDIAGISHILLFDMLGKMVKETTTVNKKFNIDMSEFPIGMYHLKIENSKQNTLLKIIKN